MRQSVDPWLPGAGVGTKRSDYLIGTLRVSFWSDKNVLKLYSDDGCTTQWM